MKKLPSKRVLHQLFSYNPDTGDFRWKERPLGHFKDEKEMDRWNGRYAGEPVGFYDSDRCVLGVKLNNSKYMGARLIWKMVYGKDPSKCIRYLDNNPANLKIENIRL